MDKNSLLHTTRECKYRWVFVPKYRRQVIYGKIGMTQAKYYENFQQKQQKQTFLV